MTPLSAARAAITIFRVTRAVDPARRISPIVAVALAVIAGSASGLFLVPAWPALWAGSGALGLAVAAWRFGRGGWLRGAALLGIACAAAAWAGVAGRHVERGTVARFVGPEPRLVSLVGTVASEPELVPAGRGAFADFAHTGPGTSFLLSTRRIRVDGTVEAARGRLTVRVGRASLSLEPGQRVAVDGWLRAFVAPRNPGVADLRRRLRRAGIAGHVSVPGVEQVRVLAAAGRDAGLAGRIAAWRRAARRAARRALFAGGPEPAGFLEAVLLGERGAAHAVEDAFRTTGLGHVLAVSGMHVGILAALLWWALGGAIGRPSGRAAAVLAVLGGYLLVVPWRVPIVRASVMAGLLCAGYGAGRRVRGLDMLAVAAILLLAADPTGLRSPGFQLSFAAVAALLLFARPVSRALAPPPAIPRGTWAEGARAALATYAAAQLVAFGVTAPLVLHHFGLACPWTPLFSAAALPALGGVLLLGYLKIGLGLLLPGAGAALAAPLGWAASALTGGVEAAAGWPGVVWRPDRAPTVAWTVAATGLVVLLFAGAARRRPAWIAAGAVACAAWLAADTAGPTGPFRRAVRPAARRPVLAWNAFAVGHGAAHLIRIWPDQAGAEPWVALYDAGSSALSGVGSRRLVPALRHLGVDEIDALFVSHGDLDHYSGVLDVAETIPLERAYVPPRLLRQARAGRAGETPRARLLAGLRAEGVPVRALARGWRKRVGGAAARVLWPPRGFDAADENNHSLVLRVSRAGRRLLLAGDLEDRGMRGLVGRAPDFAADLTAIPHHGAADPATRRWLWRIDPTLAVASTGDRGAVLPGGCAGSLRRATARDGMIEAVVSADGSIRLRTFRGEALRLR